MSQTKASKQSGYQSIYKDKNPRRRGDAWSLVRWSSEENWVILDPGAGVIVFQKITPWSGQRIKGNPRHDAV